MEDQITIREAVTGNDVEVFWEQLRSYFKRDMFPDPEDKDRAYFLSDTEYRAQVQELHDRETDRCHYLFFHRGGQDIGISLTAVYPSEDSRCFIMEFCVYPQFRGGGTGKQCAEALLSWARARGARYAELNCGSDERRVRFWENFGFRKNGADPWGEPLMLLPSREELPLTVELLADPFDWQLLRLENGFKMEIGEEFLSEEKQQRLQQAIAEGRITFFVAKLGWRMVGMCSVVRCFSTFSCCDVGVFEDFYIEPVFRGKGIARRLARVTQDWCEDGGIPSLTVCCAPCDEDMYRALGFDLVLGKNLAHTG